MTRSALRMRANEYQNRPDLRPAYNQRTPVRPSSKVGFFQLRLLSSIGFRYAEFRTHWTTRLACSRQTLTVHQLSPYVPQSSDLQPETLEKWQSGIGNYLGGISYCVQVVFGAQHYAIIRGIASEKNRRPVSFPRRAIAFLLHLVVIYAGTTILRRGR